MWTITRNLKSSLYKKGVKSVLHPSNTFHPKLVMSFANMDLRIAMPVGGRNYQLSLLCLRGRIWKTVKLWSNSHSHSDKALSGLRMLAPMEISQTIQPNQLDSQELKSVFLTVFICLLSTEVCNSLRFSTCQPHYFFQKKWVLHPISSVR